MRPSIKDFFHFNRSERRGTISLLVIIVGVIIFKELLIYANPDPILSTVNIDSLQQVVELHQREKVEENHEIIEENVNKFHSLQLVEFNPNNLSIETWQKFGLSKKQAETIKNYEEKGGVFRIKTDVQKMYTVSNALYAKLEPYILLPDSFVKQDYNESLKKREPKAAYETWKKEKRVYPKVLINTADTSEFKKLYGIGDYYALKIVEYRESLGGFVSKDQLKEIWGLKPETLVHIDTQLVYNSVPIRKININTASVDELKAHPYIFWKVANSIVNYREQHGNYMDLNTIKKSVLISDSLFLQLKPYLKY